MEGKKNSQKASSSSADVSISGKKVQEFAGDVKTEFKKITWVTRDELRSYTKIVIGGTFFLGLGIYITDLVIQACLAGLGSIVRLIGG